MESKTEGWEAHCGGGGRPVSPVFLGEDVWSLLTDWAWWELSSLAPPGGWPSKMPGSAPQSAFWEDCDLASEASLMKLSVSVTGLSLLPDAVLSVATGREGLAGDVFPDTEAVSSSGAPSFQLLGIMSPVISKALLGPGLLSWDTRET